MKRVTKEEAIDLFKKAPLHELGMWAKECKDSFHPDKVVTFVVDRNINYTNVCINRCRFCAFYREEGHPEAYLLSEDQIAQKIQETLALGGTQILLQGGINPSLDLDYFCRLLRFIKGRFKIHIHGFSPTEIAYLAKRHRMSIEDVLTKLVEAGLDSIPGGGAEILSDRVRDLISPNKIKTSEWLQVMEVAHSIGMKTTATMMFGSIEEPEEIIEHLDHLRSLQDRTGGFTAFIPWSFQPLNTALSKERGLTPATAVEYLRVVAISRIYLDNFANVQASWVTQGIKLAQISLLFGANDLGSTMIEENVVRSAGVTYRVSIDEMVRAIKQAGFRAIQRDTFYRHLKDY